MKKLHENIYNLGIQVNRLVYMAGAGEIAQAAESNINEHTAKIEDAIRDGKSVKDAVADAKGEIDKVAAKAKQEIAGQDNTVSNGEKVVKSDTDVAVEADTKVEGAKAAAVAKIDGSEARYNMVEQYVTRSSALKATLDAGLDVRANTTDDLRGVAILNSVNDQIKASKKNVLDLGPFEPQNTMLMSRADTDVASIETKVGKIRSKFGDEIDKRQMSTRAVESSLGHNEEPTKQQVLDVRREAAELRKMAGEIHQYPTETWLNTEVDSALLFTGGVLDKAYPVLSKKNPELAKAIAEEQKAIANLEGASKAVKKSDTYDEDESKGWLTGAQQNLDQKGREVDNILNPGPQLPPKKDTGNATGVA